MLTRTLSMKHVYMVPALNTQDPHIRDPWSMLLGHGKYMKDSEESICHLIHVYPGPWKWWGILMFNRHEWLYHCIIALLFQSCSARPLRLHVYGLTSTDAWLFTVCISCTGWQEETGCQEHVVHRVYTLHVVPCVWPVLKVSHGIWPLLFPSRLSHRALSRSSKLGAFVLGWTSDSMQGPQDITFTKNAADDSKFLRFAT